MCYLLISRRIVVPLYIYPTTLTNGCPSFAENILGKRISLMHSIIYNVDNQALVDPGLDKGVGALM